MSVYRRDGKWKAVIWIDDKRIKSKSGFPTKSSAKEWHDLTMLEYKKGPEKFQDRSVGITFDELLRFYTEMHLPTLRSETIRRYLVDIDLRIRPYFQFRRFDTITPELIARFRMGLMAHLGKKSVNNCMAVLRAIFCKGLEMGLVKENPFVLKPLKLPEQKYRWWDEREYLSRFLEEAKKTPHYVAYRLALDCGLRLGEIIGLSKQDIDLSRCQVHVHRQWIDKENCYGPPKHNRERFVRFDPNSDLKTVLAEAVLRSPHPEALIVTRTGRRLGARKLSGYFFKKVSNAAGVPEICFHDMRHTFASWYMITVGDIWSLKSILGHSDIQTTQRYAHLSEKHIKVPNMDWESGVEISRAAPAPMERGSGLKLV